MAKKRRPARSTKKASSARAPKKKKTAKRRVRKPAARVVAGKSLNLKELRARLALAVGALTKKVGSTPAAESKLDDTRRRLSQWMTDIDDICTPEEEAICGPSMDLPIP